MGYKDVKKAASRQIVSGIRQLYKNKEFCDLCVIVAGKKFHCHRVVLASASQYVKQQILPKKRVIHVKDEDVSPKQFELLLKILYKGHCLISQKTAKDLLKMAGCLKIDFLTKLCEKFLMKNMLPEDSVQVWKSAEKYRLRILSDKAMKMTLDNIENIREDEWLALPKSLLLILLCQKPNMSMERTCDKILSWVKQDEKVRKKHLVEFLPFLSFPLMNPTYVSRLTGTSHHFSDILFEYASEGNTYHVEGILEKDINIQRQILKRQSFKLTKPDLKIQARGLVVEGQTGRVYSFGLQDDRLEFHNLRSPSITTGKYIASCMWRNEVYLSGDKHFVVYKPDNNQWEVLPDLPDGKRRRKHSMSAVNSNIYVLGGRDNVRQCGNDIQCSILKYSIGDRKWNDVCNLPVNVADASSAVLGHRIYVFGGKKADKKPTALVQCVDTHTGIAYIAGKFPFPTYGLRAFSNGGIIYLVLPTGEVLRMWEDFYLADKRELEYARKKDQPLKKPTVLFRKIAQIPARRKFGACLYEDQIIVYGGQTKQQDVCKSVKINISSGVTKEIDNAVNKKASFDLHTVNLPVLESSKAPSDASGISYAAPKTTSTQTTEGITEPSHKCDKSPTSSENSEYSNRRMETSKRKHPSDQTKSTCVKRLAINSSFVESSIPKTTPHTTMEETTLELGLSSLNHERPLRDLNSA